MLLHARLVIACAFIACVYAATLPHTPANFEKKFEQIIKEELGKDGELPAQIDPQLNQPISVKDVDNNLRNRVTLQSIPVKIVVDDAPTRSLKVDAEKNGVSAEAEDDFVIKKTFIDVKNLGPPQRQQHDTQNPEHFSESQKSLVTMKQAINETQNVFNQGIQTIQQWFANNEQFATIQQSLANLQISFTSQMSKLNETFNGFLQDNSKPPSPPTELVDTKIDTPLESGLNKPGSDIENEVKSLVKSAWRPVESLLPVFPEKRQATVDNNNPSGVQLNPFQQAMQNIQNNIIQGFNNVTTTIQNVFNVSNTNSGPGNFFQNIFSVNPPSEVQSDESGGTTLRPSLWQGIQNSLSNILRPVQNQVPQGSPSTQAAAPNRPIVQAIQNNPVVQGVVNLIQPTNKPPPAIQSVVGSNEVPNQSSQSKPEPDQKEKPVSVEKIKPEENKPSEIPAVTGPIRKIIQQNPIVQGISSTVQKIQHSINNPEKPRDAVEGIKEEESAVKGAIFINAGHGGQGGSGDNNNIHGDGGEVDTKSEKVKTITEVKKSTDSKTE